MPIFVLFVSAGVLFDGTFSPVSILNNLLFPISLTELKNIIKRTPIRSLEQNMTMAKISPLCILRARLDVVLESQSKRGSIVES